LADSNAALGSAAFNLTSWPGMSDAAALKMAKNYTGIFDEDKDPLKRSGEALGEKIKATFGPEVTKDFTKANDAQRIGLVRDRG
jgi:hypothetical protein